MKPLKDVHFFHEEFGANQQSEVNLANLEPNRMSRARGGSYNTLDDNALKKHLSLKKVLNQAS